jgi:hypothetical protein
MASVPAKSEQAEYAVFELLPCSNDPADRNCMSPRPKAWWSCKGCTGAGTRVDLSSGVKVERHTVDAGLVGGPPEFETVFWLAVPSTEEPEQ